jgi:CheY-like chemotaxis protein/DNA-binding phage protein
MFAHDHIWNAIDHLARSKGWTVSRLAVRAGLDSTSLNLSKRRGADGQARWPSTETISKLLEATGTSLAQFAAWIEAAEANPRALLQADILLVDEDGLFRDATAAILRAAGYRVHHGADQRDALDYIESEQPLDLLCTDLVMPDGLGGVALARRARARRPGLKILYVTGYDIPGITPDRTMQMLRKPLPEKTLLEAIDRLIGPKP